MARVSTGLRDALPVNMDGEVYDRIYVDDFPEDVFREILNRDPGDDELDTRSQVVQIRLPNGDLILGFFPQGDTYFEIERYYT